MVRSPRVASAEESSKTSLAGGRRSGFEPCLCSLARSRLCLSGLCLAAPLTHLPWSMNRSSRIITTRH